MPKFRALELAIEQATQQRDAMARKHAQAQRTIQHARGQLDQLQVYSSDTDARWVDGRAVSLSAELIKHHYQFMDRLQNAVRLQHDVIANLESQLGAAHQLLLHAEFRLAGLKQVIQSRRAALGLVERRREQRVTDEFAAQRHTRRAAAQTTEGSL